MFPDHGLRTCSKPSQKIIDNFRRKFSCGHQYFQHQVESWNVASSVLIIIIITLYIRSGQPLHSHTRRQQQARAMSYSCAQRLTSIFRTPYSYSCTQTLKLIKSNYRSLLTVQHCSFMVCSLIRQTLYEYSKATNLSFLTAIFYRLCPVGL